MKIIIADNEKLIRYTIKSMLEEIKTENQVIGEAKDGEELVELIKKYAPDVAFVDIKMPKLNGLEAIKIAKNYSPETKWIILSSYSEFEYAKEAISLNAYEYLLKPVSPDKLEDTLSAILKLEENNNITTNETFENEINSLIYNTRSFDEKKLNQYLKSNFIGTNFIFDSHLNENDKSKLQINFCSSVRECISKSISKFIKIALITMPNGNISIICTWDKDTENTNDKKIDDFLKKLIIIVKNHSSESFFITIFKTKTCQSFLEINKQLEDLDQLSKFRITTDLGITASFCEIEKKISVDLNHTLINLNNLLIELSDSYREKSYLGFIKRTEQIESLVNNEISESKTVSNILNFLKHTINLNPPDLKSFSEIVKALKNHADTLLEENNNDEKNSTDIITSVNKYIDKNFAQDIGIAQIAYKLNLTPNYLSYLFHKHTGVTFIKYLKKIRILKAKELLIKHGSKVNDVAKKVGYYSPQYFSKLFKKECGCHPSEYNKK